MPFPSASRALLRVLRLALLLYVVFVAVVWLFAERLIFQPPARRYARTPDMVMIPRAGGGRIAAVHLRNPHAVYTVLYSHGNGEDLGTSQEFLERMRDAGFNVLAYDYSGYGLSTGRASERASYRDIDAAYDYLTRTLRVPPERIIAHGRSLGGGVAADLASRRPVAGVVLESTFTSIFRVVRAYPLVPFDRFRTLDKMPRITAPMLVIHGTDDEVVPFWQGRRLYDAARPPKRSLWVEGAHHNDLGWVADQDYWHALWDFALGLPRPANADNTGGGG